MIRTVCRYVMVGILLMLLLVSCPAPFKAEQLELLQDTDAPGIKILSPSDYSEYSTVISLRCSITDESIDGSTSDNSITVVYEIPGTTFSGVLSENDDGTFSAAINASALEGSHTIKVTATDINGNTAYGVVNIVEPASGGDISGFKATPSNKQVTIEWDSVPFAESYTIYEYSYGEVNEDVTSPYVWEGLSNGDLYSFSITAQIPSDIGEDAYSATIKALPLSTRTFAPKIKKTGYKSVTIEWWDDTNIAAEYRVQRSTSINGPWKVRRTLTSSEFTDTDVEHNGEYWYRVYLPDYPDIVSAPVSAVPARFVPFDEIEVVVTSPNPGGGAYSWAVAVSGDYAFIGSVDKGLVIADISDPGNPVITGSASAGDYIRGMVVSGDYAYAAVSGSGLVVFDVSDKSAPVRIGGYDTDYTASDVAVSGNYAYIADGSNGLDGGTDSSDGLVVVDISTPSSPAFTGSYNTAGDAKGVAVSGNYAYVADGTNGLVVLDILDPANIALESTLDYDSGSDGVSAEGVFVKGSYAYIADSGEGLVIADVSAASSPSTKGLCATVFPKRVTVGTSYAYVADGSSGISVVDITDTAAPYKYGTLSYTGSDSYDIAISGSYVFAADGTQGLVSADVAVQDKAERTGSVSGTYHGGGIAVAGDYAYVVDKDGGNLSVVSLSDPSSPLELSTIDAHDFALKVRISGSYAYVANDNWGMTIYDISDPYNPKEAANTYVSGTSEAIKDIAVSGSYAYAADSTNGLVVFDVCDPENPSSVSTTAISEGSPSGIAVSGGYVFVTLKVGTSDGALDVFDVSDPLNPYRTAHITAGLANTSGTSYGIDTDGSYAYIAGGSGFVIYDVSNPSSLNDTSIAAGSFSMPGTAASVSVHGKYAYVADEDGVFLIMDVADPVNPEILCTVGTSNSAYDVAVAGEYAYAAVDGSSTGMDVIRLWEEN